LKALEGDTPRSFISVLGDVSYDMGLSNCALSATLKYSGKRKFYTKMKHARSFLLKKALIQKVEKGYALTDTGKAYLATLR
jgi:hypothetical protein